MARAFILCGDEERFAGSAFALQEYLNRGGTKNVRSRFVDAEFLSDWWLRCELAGAIARPGPLLLAYNGHGAPGALAPRDGCRIRYDDIAEAVTGRKGVTLIVNDCCFADGMSAALEKVGADPKRVGVIAACGADGYGYSTLLGRVIDAWGHEDVFRPIPMVTLVGAPDPGTFDEYDEERDVTVCHIADVTMAVEQESAPNQARRWGTTDLDRLFFPKNAV